MNKNVRFITRAAVIAALYIVLTLLANALGLANYAVQVRFSEMLTVLPFFLPAAVPGLFAGCILANLLTGCMPLDIVFGSLATLLGALGTYGIGRLAGNLPSPGYASPKASSPLRETASATRKKAWMPWLAPLPPILANTLIVPFVLAYVYRFEGSIPYFMLTVGAGELISCGLLGMLLFFALQKYPSVLLQD